MIFLNILGVIYLRNGTNGNGTEKIQTKTRKRNFRTRNEQNGVKKILRKKIYFRLKSVNGIIF